MLSFVNDNNGIAYKFLSFAFLELSFGVTLVNGCLRTVSRLKKGIKKTPSQRVRFFTLVVSGIEDTGDQNT